MTQTENTDYVYEYHWGRIIAAFLLLISIVFVIYWLINHTIVSSTPTPEDNLNIKIEQRVAQPIDNTTEEQTQASVAEFSEARTEPALEQPLASEKATANTNLQATATPPTEKQNTEPPTSIAESSNKSTKPEDGMMIQAKIVTSRPDIYPHAPIQPLDPEETKAKADRFTQAIQRAKLTYSVKKLEPGKALAENIEVKGDALEKVYFFTEVTGQAGQVHYHNWYLNGKLRAKVPISINADRWRCYSSKFLTRHHAGDWEVKITNKAGKVLAQSRFTVNKQ